MHDDAYRQGVALAQSMLATGSATTGDVTVYWEDKLRCLAAAMGEPAGAVYERVAAFHAQRLEAEPDLTRYPELRGYRDELLAQFRGMRDGGLSERTLVLHVTLNFWRDTRLVQETGRAYCAPTLPEKCRVVYMPESDQGALHAKNVDDPLTYWRPRPPHPPHPPWPHTHPLWFDGVGSGLHLDEMPPEIFPVEVIPLCKQHCTTVEAAREFMVRYNYFWSSQNLLVHDLHGSSVAFEKTRCRVAARGPNAQGINFITGMGALDPGISAFQKAQREKYLAQQNWDEDSVDGRFWKICEGKWRNMTAYIAELSREPTFENLKALLEKRDPDGPMCLTGDKCHPDDAAPGCTLIMDIWFVDRKRLHRRQWRGDTPAYLDAPEVVDFV